MDDSIAPSPSRAPDVNGAVKRKRSSSAEQAPAPPAAAPPAKAPKTSAGGSSSTTSSGHHLQINYLARQYVDNLLLVSTEDGLPTTLRLLGDYAGVLDRHESLAVNLGAKPLGPILVERFERLFDGPPRILRSNGREGTIVTWLDVVEFARHKPEQFNLEKTREGVRVCQFYTKQCRVEITEDDYVLISSGMPQKLIPPQPIAEDEEKELGTLEIMEKSIGSVIHLADQGVQVPTSLAAWQPPTQPANALRIVSAKARHLRNRLVSRKNAIVNRREVEAAATTVEVPRVSADPDTHASNSPTSTGFTAVNSRTTPSAKESVPNGVSSVANGRVPTVTTASPSTKAELMSYFTGQRERNTVADISDVAVKPKSKAKPSLGGGDIDYASILLHSASPAPGANQSLLAQYSRPPNSAPGSASKGAASAADKFDDSGPFKAEMLSRMDSMQRGDRVMPPCDRCRRLHMDCLKNLTACLGCTKKHAKCSWQMGQFSPQNVLQFEFSRQSSDRTGAY